MFDIIVVVICDNSGIFIFEDLVFDEFWFGEVLVKVVGVGFCYIDIFFV